MTGTGAISYPSSTWTRPNAVLYPGGGNEPLIPHGLSAEKKRATRVPAVVEAR